LAPEDVAFLITLLPDSNDILAAIAAAPTQLPAIQALTAERASAWAQAARGERRRPYCHDGQDLLFRRLIELPAADEALLWHLVVEDEGSAAGAMPWAAYLALAARVAERLDAQPGEASPLRAYLALARELQNPAAAEAFAQNQIDLRRVLALLANPPAGPEHAGGLVKELLPLAVFHLQETGPALKERAAALLRSVLQRPEVTAQLQALPEPVLVYLRQNFCAGHPALEATGHWIDAELSRRANAYRIEARARPARPKATAPQVMPSKPFTAADPIPENPALAPAQPATLPESPAPPRPAGPPPPPPPSDTNDPQQALDAIPTPVLGQLALPNTASPRKGDSAILLWIALVAIIVLAIAVVVGAIFYVRSLGAGAGWLPLLDWPRWT
jgi:hypothetical protein